MAGPVLHEYQWLVVVGALCAFGFGWGTGVYIFAYQRPTPAEGRHLFKVNQTCKAPVT